MDDLDKRIIRALQRDATLSNAALAEQVGASQASCWRRVKALEQDGVLAQSVRLVNAAAVHLPVNVFCHVRLRNHLPETTLAFETFLRAHPEIMEGYAMSGEWDYLLRIVCADVERYQLFLMKSLLANAAVGTASSFFALSQVKYSTALPV